MFHVENLSDTSATLFPQFVDFSYFWSVNKRCLLTIHFQFTERALAHHLIDPLGGDCVRYRIALALLHMQKCELDKAEQEVNVSIQMEYEASMRHSEIFGLKGN